MAQRASTMTLKLQFRRSTMLAAALTLLATISLSLSGASPARADRCDDIAAQLKGQIEGLKVGITAANVIYLSHPQAKELTLGLPRPQLQQRTLCQGGQPQTEAGIFRTGRHCGGPRLHHSESPTRSRAQPAASSGWGCSAATMSKCATPPRHGMHPHQDRGGNRDLARQGRVSKPVSVNGICCNTGRIDRFPELPVHRVAGIALIARDRRVGFIKPSSPPRHSRL